MTYKVKRKSNLFTGKWIRDWPCGKIVFLEYSWKVWQNILTLKGLLVSRWSSHVCIRNRKNITIFSFQLLEIGSSEIPFDRISERIILPYDFSNLVTSREEVVHGVFPNIQISPWDHGWPRGELFSHQRTKVSKIAFDDLLKGAMAKLNNFICELSFSLISICSSLSIIYLLLPIVKFPFRPRFYIFWKSVGTKSFPSSTSWITLVKFFFTNHLPIILPFQVMFWCGEQIIYCHKNSLNSLR